MKETERILNAGTLLPIKRYDMLKDIELLKIGLLAKGMQVSESARRAIEGDEKRPLTLADYASTSGIAMQLEQDIWVNALYH